MKHTVELLGAFTNRFLSPTVSDFYGTFSHTPCSVFIIHLAYFDIQINFLGLFK